MLRQKNLVLTFLSPHQTHSRSAVQFLHRLFRLAQIDDSKPIKRDILDEKHFFSSSSRSWHSTACYCGSSGTILHFLSLDNGKTEGIDSSTNTPKPSFQLLSITECSATDDALSHSREKLFDSMEDNYFFSTNPFLSTIEARLRGFTYSTLCKLGREVQPSWLMPSIPLLALNASSSGQHASSGLTSNGKGGLKELVLPFFPKYSTIQTDLSISNLSRPLAGLYQYDCSGLVIRPMPSADEDLRLPPPSLIFEGSLDDAKKLVEHDLGGKTSKIGWRGSTHRGSLIVGHPSIAGLDVRICEDWMLSSSFDEAEQAVLAGSSHDLQSSHVMSEGKNDDDEEEDVITDPKTNNADCWVEARSNMKQPSGFLKRFSSTPTIAKPPQLPYE